MSNSFGEAARKRLIANLPSTFVDPVTGYSPTGETQLTGLLAFFHQFGWVNWRNVPLYLPDYTNAKETADMLFGDTAICTEYQLFWKSKEERDLSGSMPADLLCVSRDRQRVVLIENKIGYGFTGVGGNEIKGQLAKQVDFLSHAIIPNRILVLLSGKKFFERPWYRRELQLTLAHNNRSAKVSGFLMQWEDVFSGIRVPPEMASAAI